MSAHAGAIIATSAGGGYCVSGSGRHSLAIGRTAVQINSAEVGRNRDRKLFRQSGPAKKMEF